MGRQPTAQGVVEKWPEEDAAIARDAALLQPPEADQACSLSLWRRPVWVRRRAVSEAERVVVSEPVLLGARVSLRTPRGPAIGSPRLRKRLAL